MNPDASPKPNGSPNGRGGQNDNTPGTKEFTDKTKPLPPVSQKSPDGNDPMVAPESSQPPLVIRRLQDLLKDDKFTPNVEKQLGMTKDEAEQFVKKFEKKEQPGPAGPGQEIKAKPEKDKILDPNRKGPEFNTNSAVSKRTQRSGSTIPQDKLSGLSEGGKSSPPPELRKQVEAYNKSIATTKSNTPSGSKP